MWSHRRLGVILKPFSEKNHPTKQLLSITRENGVIIRNISDENDNHNFIPDDLSNYKLIREGQFGMNKMKAWQGSYGISSFTGIVSPAYYIFSLSDIIEPKFFNVAIRSKSYVSMFGSASDGVRIGQWDLSKNRMKNIMFAYPPLPEQTRIATYLDDKCAKVDKAIVQKERLIELLEERKQIIIQNAVTKGLPREERIKAGLPPDVKMKDSGIDWIGEIPEDWEVKKLKHIAFMRSGEMIKPEDFSTDGFPVYGGNGFRGYTHDFTNDGDHVLIGRQGVLCGNVNYAYNKFYASEHAIVVYPHKKENIYWLGNSIKVANLGRLSQSAAQPGIAVSVIKNISFPYPEKQEQLLIGKYISKIENTIENSMTIITSQIEKLKEYKATLIGSLVTGKVRVMKDGTLDKSFGESQNS